MLSFRDRRWRRVTIRQPGSLVVCHIAESRVIYATGQGFIRQMLAAYSAMVRLLENFLE